MQKNINVLIAIRFTNCLIFYLGIIIPYYQERLGLGFSSFMIADACFTAVIILGEVPSGWISDVWQRRYVMSLAAILGIAGFLAMYFASGLEYMILGNVLLGTSFSLTSGTDSSLLYDSLLSMGQEDSFVRLEGKRQAAGLWGVGLASTLGGFIYGVYPRIPFVLTILAYTMTLILCFQLHEPERRKKRPEKNPLSDMVTTMRFAFKDNRTILTIVLFTALFYSTTRSMMWSQQPYYTELELHKGWFGVLVATGYVLSGTSMYAAHWLGRHIDLHKTLIGAWFVALLAATLSGMYVGFHGILLLMLGGPVLYGIIHPRIEDAIHRTTGSERRATVLSATNLIRQLAFMPLCLMLGFASDSYGIGIALIGVASWLMVSGLLLLAWIRR